MKRLLAAALVIVVSSIMCAQAQTYPSKPVSIIVPFAAGGPSDAIARILVEGMRSSLGQPLIIESVVGAGGSIGTGRVARSAPDGYHWVSAIGAHMLPTEQSTRFISIS